MSDAVGGVVNMMLILFFVVFIALYMSFNINYQKAFNVKNKIVSIYEEYNGKCDKDCSAKIKAYEGELGYGKMKLSETGFYCPPNCGYCIRGIQTGQTITKKKSKDSKILREQVDKKCYFEVLTKVEIAIPIINNLMDLRVFTVTGQTSSMNITDSRDCNTIAKSAKSC